MDFGSLWLIIQQRSGGTFDDANIYATLLMILGCAGVAALALCAPRRPRFAQLAFLVVALFVLTNKVYSPQYVLWLIPLAALARPRWRDFLIWQGCEVALFPGDLDVPRLHRHRRQAPGPPRGRLPTRDRSCICSARSTCARWWCGTRCGPNGTRSAGTSSDDPGGGVLDRAPDVFVRSAAVGAAQADAPSAPRPVHGGLSWRWEAGTAAGGVTGTRPVGGTVSPRETASHRGTAGRAPDRV